MPGRDGTGPLGFGPMSFGPMTGRGFRAFYGCRRGFGRYYFGQNVGMTEEDILKEEKELLQKRLDDINKQIDTM